MSKPLIYDNRFFSGVLKLFGKVFLRLMGWKIVGDPPKCKKYVMIAVPHTSNWDFPIFMAVIGVFGLRGAYLGKDSLFKGPFGWLFYYLGGIPVVRQSMKAGEVIEQAVSALDGADTMVLGIAPEGTRTKVKKWKTGFYRIAEDAGVPIAPGYLNAKTKETGFGPLFYPTGDMEADLKELEAFYADKQGINPPDQYT